MRRFTAFVLSSVFLLVATIISVKVCYFSNEWEGYQKQFNKLEASKTQSQMDDFKKSLDSDSDFKKLESSLSTEEEKVNSQEMKDKQKDLDAKIARLKYESYKTEREAKFSKSRLGALDYQIIKFTAENKNTNSVLAEKDELMKVYDSQKQLDAEAKDRYAKAQQESKDLTLSYTTLKAKYDDKMSKFDILAKKLDSISHRPIEIQQVILPELDSVDRCMTCHMAIDKEGFEDKKYPLVFQTHPNRDLYLGKHKVIDFGCVVCHQGQGLTTKVNEAHGHVPFWDKPMFEGKQAEASCIKCHKTTDNIKADFFEKGKEIVTASNCFACHKVEGQPVAMKNAPPLLQAASKLNASWMVNWVQNPRHYLPRSKMPTFMLTKDDATAVTTYVLSTSDPNFGIVKNVVPKPELASQGEKVFQAKGCNSCHSIRGVGGTVGPDLGRVGSKDNPTWMYNWIKNPRAYHPTTVMPNLGLSDQETLSVVSYLQTFKWDKMPEYQVDLSNKKLADQGKDIMKNYGCASCHNVVGLDAAQNCPDLSGVADKDTHKFDFGYAHRDPARGIYHTRESYIYNKIRTPWIYNDFVKPRMPRFWFTDEQASAVYTYISGVTGKYDKIPYKFIYKPKGSVEESNEETKGK